VGFNGVTEIEIGVAELTVSEVDPLTDASAAVMLAVPAETAFASPDVGAVLLTVATLVPEDDQVTLPVKFCVLLSL
jgi:hypothetical protein